MACAASCLASISQSRGAYAVEQKIESKLNHEQRMTAKNGIIRGFQPLHGSVTTFHIHTSRSRRVPDAKAPVIDA